MEARTSSPPGCEYCGGPLRGRSDKAFCDARCKNLYHNGLYGQKPRTPPAMTWKDILMDEMMAIKEGATIEDVEATMQDPDLKPLFEAVERAAARYRKQRERYRYKRKKESIV